ncbi:MAG: alpha/beta hydrolase [Octadecabacter sp.]|nr:alpha/beta hydrolase [Octadecabacter sp.]
MPFFNAADGTQLYYTDEGTGTPVLALAGLTRNTADFDHVAPHLDCRLIRMDYRGRGQSEWADPATYSIPQEAADALALLDHLRLDKAAILGTSRGGLIGMFLAATARDRLLGVTLNDIGPDIDEAGLEIIKAYVGRNPAQKTHAEAATFRDAAWTQFKNVPMNRWLQEVRNHYAETPNGLVIKYDPKLREAVFESGTQPAPDLWPLFEAMADLPLCIIRGANSDLLTAATFNEMVRRRPDADTAEVPGRGHVPFLDEPEALSALQNWVSRL